MSRKVKRVHYSLDTKGLTELSHEEIKTILRGADEIIARGGRSLLVKILKGSRSKDVLAHGADQCPVYGSYTDLANEEILAKVDWVIEHGYLRVEYDYRLPLLVYTGRGWEIERETYAEEIFQSLRQSAHSGEPIDMAKFKDRNRELIWLVLDKVAGKGDARFIPLLEAWAALDYQKVQARIHGVIRKLQGGAVEPRAAREDPKA